MEALLSGYAILKTAGDFETLSLSMFKPKSSLSQDPTFIFGFSSSF